MLFARAQQDVAFKVNVFLNNDLGNTDEHIDWLICACFHVSTLTAGPAQLKVFVLTPSQNTSLPISDYYDGRIRKNMALFHKAYVLIKIEYNFWGHSGLRALKFSILWWVKETKVLHIHNGQVLSHWPVSPDLILQTFKLLSWSWQSCLEFCTHWKTESLDSVSVWHCPWVVHILNQSIFVTFALCPLLYQGCSELISVAFVIASDHMERDLHLTCLSL